MNITVHDTSKLRKIGVLGDLAHTAEISQLSQALSQRGEQGLELVFYDARTLPAVILEQLLALHAASVQLKIRAYHNYLLFQLMRLNLPALGVFASHSLPPAPEFSAIVLGGSADSLDKIFSIIEALPPSNAAIFIVQHFPENELSHLDELLRVRTEYSVVMPQHLCDIQPNTIYIAPPAHQMKVAHGKVYLTKDHKVNYARPSIEVLFKTVAEEYRERCLAVLLCGYGNDGVAALSFLRKLGSYVLVENSTDCGARALTDAGAMSGAAHHVFSLPELRCFIAAAVAGRSSTVSEHLLDLLLEAVLARYGYDYRNYQCSTVTRRLENLRGQLGVNDFFSLQREILSDADVFERMFLELSINVTAFFRHPEQMRLLRNKILPYLDSFPHIKIWSAGCANGKEVYSLAILLDELGLLHKTQIFATDINPYQLEEARNGLYPIEKSEVGEQNYIASGGTGKLSSWLLQQDGYIKVHPKLAKHVQFYLHSLAHDGPFQEFQLILCRNVLIYFHPPLQHQVMELFARSLHHDGFLMLGPSESMSFGEGERFFTTYANTEKVFRWDEGKSHVLRG